jgi:hypothetical protein
LWFLALDNIGGFFDFDDFFGLLGMPFVWSALTAKACQT